MSADATRLAAAFRGTGPLLEGLERPPATVAEGYALQDEMRKELDRPTVGWKIAHATRSAQVASGLDAPTVAPLLEGMIVPGETMFAAHTFTTPIVEAEIALELGQALAGPCRKEQAIAAIRGVRVAIEVADSRYVDRVAMGIAAQIGDLNGAGALVIGPLGDLNELKAMRDAEPTMRLGDGSIAPALSNEERPDPIAALAFLAGFLAERDLSLPAGSIITTGTHSLPVVSGPGQIAARFGDTARVGARLGAPRGG